MLRRVQRKQLRVRFVTANIHFLRIIVNLFTLSLLIAANECMANNGGCLNGATCEENVGEGRMCECVDGFVGDECQIGTISFNFPERFSRSSCVIVCLVSENECTTQDPCVNGACIENSDGSFDRCNCTSTNMKGANCELRKPRKSTLSNVINIFYLLSLFLFSAVL